jgi:hypothetical protein
LSKSRWPLADDDFAAAVKAPPYHVWHTREIPGVLEVPLFTALVAICTYGMKWFGALSIGLNRASEGTGSQILQLVPLLLSFPCFKASNFFFKLSYRLNQRRLFRLRICKGGLHREDLLVKLDGIFEELRGVPQTAIVLTISLAALTALNPWLMAMRSGMSFGPRSDGTV